MNVISKATILILMLSGLIYAAEPDSLVIITTGNYRGRADGCVCAGGSVGGLARRATLIKQRFDNYRIIGVDCGGFLDLDPVGGKTASNCTLEGLSNLGLMVCGVTVRDMFYGKDFVTDAAYKNDVALVCCNIVDGRNGRLLFDKWNVIESNGINIGVTGIARHQPGLRFPGLGTWTTTPYDSIPMKLNTELPKNIDILVLLTDIGEEELRLLLPSIPDFDLVFTSSRDVKSKSPFNIGSAVVLHPRTDGGAVDGIIIPIEAGNLSLFNCFSYPLKRQVTPDTEVESWLENCMKSESQSR